MPAAWTQEEDNALLAAIPSDSPVEWNAVAAALSGGRSRGSVWSRFSDYLVATRVGQAKAQAQNGMAIPTSLLVNYVKSEYGKTPGFPRDNAITQILKKHVSVATQADSSHFLGCPPKRERMITIGQSTPKS
jgi:hypothetical protein